MANVIDNQQFRDLLAAYPAKAIVILQEAYHDSLEVQAFKLTKDDVASEDIVQEAFIIVWENHKRFRHYRGQSIEHYLKRIVRNKSIKWINHSLIKGIQKSSPIIGIQESIEANIIYNETSQILRTLVAAFPRRERECVLMRMDDEMSNQEIAGVLKVTVKAVERSLTSARKRLRKLWWK